MIANWYRNLYLDMSAYVKQKLNKWAWLRKLLNEAEEMVTYAVWWWNTSCDDLESTNVPNELNKAGEEFWSKMWKDKLTFAVICNKPFLEESV